MDISVIYISIGIFSLICYFILTNLFNVKRSKCIYTCPLESSVNSYCSLLPIDFYDKSTGFDNQHGGYIYASDPNVVLEQLRRVVDILHSQGSLKSLDPYNLIMIHERLAFTNSNDLVNWFTVQFNLFTGSISALGTDIHSKLIEDARHLRKLGCFALTERGAGVLSGLLCDTVAYYNKKMNRIVIHTPNEDAKKSWISYAGNSQIEYAVVFAKWCQSDVNKTNNKSNFIETSVGKLCVTPHVVAIVIRIRENGVLATNLRIDQCYTRSDFRSNCFGTITFTEFNTEPENLLNRYCSIDTQTGNLQVINNCPKLFFKLSNRLLVGRLCLSATALVCAKMALNLVINKVYNSKRCQFSYVTDQIQMMIQQICEMDSYFRQLIKRFQIDSSKITNIEDLLEENLDEILLIKAFIPPTCRSIVTKCRELLGAESILANTRMAENHASSYANCLAEGDSVIMALAFVGHSMQKYKRLSIRNWRLLLFMFKVLFFVSKKKRIDYMNSHQTEILNIFQQMADGIFKSQPIQSNLQSIPIPNI